VTSGAAGRRRETRRGRRGVGDWGVGLRWRPWQMASGASALRGGGAAAAADGGGGGGRRWRWGRRAQMAARVGRRVVAIVEAAWTGDRGGGVQLGCVWLAALFLRETRSMRAMHAGTASVIQGSPNNNCIDLFPNCVFNAVDFSPIDLIIPSFFGGKAHGPLCVYLF
jgi:hypothetical protein